MRFVWLLLLIAASPMMAKWKHAEGTSSVDSMRNQNRPLIVFFASTEPNSLYQRQMKSISQHQIELKERDVVVLLAEDDAVNLRRNPSLDVLRRRHHIRVGSFTVVLVGKDGGERFRSHGPVTIERLDALIDAMPMRQQEVRDGQHRE